VNILYIYNGNVSLTTRQNAYTSVTFQANNWFCIRSWANFYWKLCEITVFCHRILYRIITR